MLQLQDNINYIIQYYEAIEKRVLSNINLSEQLSQCVLWNNNSGIGDGLMTYIMENNNDNIGNFKVLVNENVMDSLKAYNPYVHSLKATTEYMSDHPLVHICNMQQNVPYPGHFIQNVQYCCGFPVQKIPKPKLQSAIQSIKNRVVMTFDRGVHGPFQTNIHPRPRILYPEHKEIIEQFIQNNNHKYEFIEVGKTSSNIRGAENLTNLGISNTADIIASCDIFFGIHNGLMHIAAGLNKKSIIIINFPKAYELVLPMLVRTDYPDVDWLYPQNVHLHQDNESHLVPQFSYTNLEKAFNGDIYPYFNYDSFYNNIPSFY